MSLVRFLLISTLFIGLLLEVIATNCRENERQALQIFKQSLIDDSGILSSWENNEDCCQWRGVTCSNRTGHVLMLKLQPTIDGYLRGTISPSLLNLSHLNHLDLSFNDFNGTDVPKFIGSLKRLQYLDLSVAGFSGSIPYQLGNLSELISLDLALNKLKGSIPESLGNMKSLEQLSLFNNQLQGGIPESFCNLCSLNSLLLHHNNLTGDLTEYIKDLSSGCVADSLEILVLDNNRLSGSIPDEIVGFSSMIDLSIGNNWLNGTISESIGQLSQLNILDLHGNFLNGVISESHFSNLSNLQTLDLSHNSLSLELSRSWIPPFNLSFIRLGSCKSGPRFPNWIQSQNNFAELDISDSIPVWFWDLSPSLRFLNLSYNQITGILPDLSSKFIGFPGLDLRSNLLTGPLPLFPSNLTSLNLSKNRFSGLVWGSSSSSGSISSRCRIKGESLQLLDLSENQLSGEILDCFQQWTSLQVLNLADNNFSGRIPSSIGSLVSLIMFNLHNNSFSGELPLSLNNCTGLKFLDLSDNSLSGEIPSLTSLVFLSLQANKFNGTISNNVCDMENIRILDLSRNKLTSTIPKCLDRFTSMARKGNLSSTIQQNYVYGDPQFGDIGPYIDKALLVWKGREYEYTKNLGFLVVIDLSSNQLSGEIPGEVTSLTGLVALNLSRNRLTGLIPEKIGRLRQVEALDLSRNRLSGEIPTSMAELTFLSHLDLSYNNLSGKIPLSTQLQNFDASTFSDNLGLCGPPVSLNCSESETPRIQSSNNNEDEDEFGKWYFVGMGVGFVVSFLGFCSAVLIKRSVRCAYFRFLDNLMDWVKVRLGAKRARSRRNF